MAAAGRESAKGSRGSSEPLLAALVAGQRRATERVAAEAHVLEATAKRVAAALRAGGRLVYLGAGSSGLLATQDGLELPGTFGLSEERIRFVTPNGERFVIDSSGEDDEDAAVKAVDALALGPDDIVIAVSASGATPFTVAGARRAKEMRAPVAAIVCRLGSPLASLADVAAVFDIGPEAVEGSTRLAAGTAQKAALSIISTLVAGELGYVHDGLMINVRPENAKLKVRARRIVERLAGVDGGAAEAALVEAGGEVATAVVAAAGPLGAAAARRLLTECGGDLAEALSRLKGARSKVNASAGMRPV
ncbi:MAG: N-acetylmuramic acid 6-phosphate etherase [Hyphomicrobiales bacterium]|nr:N-acetylmuramic acid 6-phosphate etherase [Hyphomicrobiales bacterium]